MDDFALAVFYRASFCSDLTASFVSALSTCFLMVREYYLKCVLAALRCLKSAE